MKKKPDTWVEEVKSLVEETVITEASEKVWQQFETALSKLDAESLEVLNLFFQGVPISQISREKNLSEEETKAWIDLKRKELVRQLKSTCTVRN